MKARLLFPVLAAAILLGGAGCIKLDSTLTVNADGGGKWRLIYSMPVHMVKQVQSAAVLAADMQRASGVSNAIPVPLDIPMLFDETVLRNRFAMMADQGITLSKLTVNQHGAWPTVDFTVQFDNLEALMKQPFFADLGASYRRDADGTGRLVIQAPRLGVTEQFPDLTDPKVAPVTTPFFASLRVVSRIGVPGTIRNTNAGNSDLRRGTWEWDFEQDSRSLERLNEAKMIVVFDAGAVRMKAFEKTARPPVR